MNETNLEGIKNTPYTETFINNPDQISQELLKALKSGLAPEFAEQHLKPLLEEARNVNTVNQEMEQSKVTMKIDLLRGPLKLKLSGFSGELNELFPLLKDFCAEKELSIEPQRGNAIQIKAANALTPDWVSDDGQFAVKLTSTAVWLYIKFRDKWMAQAEEPADQI